MIVTNIGTEVKCCYFVQWNGETALTLLEVGFMPYLIAVTSVSYNTPIISENLLLSILSI